jgi:DNA mismatch repair protein MutL
MRYKLNTLPQELVNQIAAGEVIERPASVVKELIDNSIDANATKIEIRVVNGGIDLIEVSDNGVGIPKESLSEIFQSHTTSKISSIEDLNELLTMGFRGEALSTILSIAQVCVISKYIDSDTGNKIDFKSYDDFTIKRAARQSGTIVLVKNIFGNIPARRKFLKTSQTEYKRILDILYPYFLIYPNIHFKVKKDRKVVINLMGIPNSKANSANKERIQEVINNDFSKKMVKVFFNGVGIKIEGFIAHPADHQKRSSNQYIFVNGRPIWDRAIARAVIQGYERYIPFGQRVPFILLISIKPELIDINVHPRKEEVRFLNPFRVYSAVEQATKKALVSVTSYKVESEFKPNYTKSQSFVNKDMDRKVFSPKDITFKSDKSGSVRDSLLFSKEILSAENYTKIEQNAKGIGNMRNIFQIFNKYITIEFEEKMFWIIDQHAAAERITFEKLKKANGQNIEKQNLLVTSEITFSSIELRVLKELKSFFNELGIDFDISKEGIRVITLPVEFIDANVKQLFDDIFQLSDDILDISKSFNKLKEDILASISCHTSIRSGQSLHRDEMVDIYKKLIECENPYSCPHGRPIVWKMSLSEIDSKFERTY